MKQRNTDSLTKAEKSWIFYDVACSSFTMLISTTIPLAFAMLMGMAQLTEAQQNNITSDFGLWGLTTSISVLIMALISPFLGAVADYDGMKKRSWAVALIFGLVGCIGMSFVNHWLGFLLLFLMARVGYTAANMFYDSMLTDVTTDERMARVSTNGYAWGYIGSCIPFIACIVILVVLGTDNIWGYRAGFLLTAVWWAVCSIPTLKNVKQTHYLEKAPEGIRVKEIFTRLMRTFHKIKQDKSLLYYILGYFCYIDGVYTVIAMATSYGAALGLDTVSMILALLVTQFVAFPCAIYTGKLAKKYGAQKLIKSFILMYVAISIFGMLLSKNWHFWVLAVAVGLCQGGIQALSRSHFGQMIPKEESNEYFGFFDIFGKFADFFGPMIIFLCTLIFKGQDALGIDWGTRVGIGALVILFIVGYIFVRKSEKYTKEPAQ